MEVNATTTISSTISSSATVVSPSPIKRAKNKAKATKTPTSSTTSSTKKKLQPPPLTPPKDWQDTYALVEELRRDRTAPCDHSGCEALPDRQQDPPTVRLQVLISLMLSSQTKDAVVGAAVRALQQDGVLNVHSLAQMTPATARSVHCQGGFSQQQDQVH